jgi:hypothetical protein
VAKKTDSPESTPMLSEGQQVEFVVPWLAGQRGEIVRIVQGITGRFLYDIRLSDGRLFPNFAPAKQSSIFLISGRNARNPHVCGALRVLRTPENRRSDRLQAVSPKFSPCRDDSVSFAGRRAVNSR